MAILKTKSNFMEAVVAIEAQDGFVNDDERTEVLVGTIWPAYEDTKRMAIDIFRSIGRITGSSDSYTIVIMWLHEAMLEALKNSYDAYVSRLLFNDRPYWACFVKIRAKISTTSRRVSVVLSDTWAGKNAATTQQKHELMLSDTQPTPYYGWNGVGDRYHSRLKDSSLRRRMDEDGAVTRISFKF